MRTGTNHLFIPGPTNIPEQVRQAMNVPMQDMRAPDFGDLTLNLFRDLKKVLRTETGTVMMFPGSGTAAWEAAITNVLNPGDKVLMSRFGQFSHLWVEMAERLGLDVEVIDVTWGKGVPVEDYATRLAADTAGEIKAVFATHNETATGVTSDIAGVRRALDDAGHDALLFVDGVSSIASIDFRMDDWGVDLAVTGSQKGLMLPAGLGILGISEKALEASKTSTMRRAYFEFRDMLATNATGYFPYTPPTQLFHGSAPVAGPHLRGGAGPGDRAPSPSGERGPRGCGRLGSVAGRGTSALLLRHRVGDPGARRRGRPRRDRDRL